MRTIRRGRSSGTSPIPTSCAAARTTSASSRANGPRAGCRSSGSTRTKSPTTRTRYAFRQSTNMAFLRSIRSSSRGRTSERGFVLAAAIFLAVLYFMLIELLLMDGSRALQEAQRFRSRIVALTLAESAAELAAAQMVNTQNAHVDVDSTDGTLTG